jgi:hypothetical protein
VKCQFGAAASAKTARQWSEGLFGCKPQLATSEVRRATVCDAEKERHNQNDNNSEQNDRQMNCGCLNILKVRVASCDVEANSP